MARFQGLLLSVSMSEQEANPSFSAREDTYPGGGIDVDMTVTAGGIDRAVVVYVTDESQSAPPDFCIGRMGLADCRSGSR